MTDSTVYLEKLSAFSRMLRLEGLSIGPAETADAGRILVSLGFENRERVRTALRTVYAKSRDEQITFDRVFDGFFLSEEAMRPSPVTTGARNPGPREDIFQSPCSHRLRHLLRPDFSDRSW